MKTLSTHAAAAKAIRAELKINFPGIKFSVRSDYNSIKAYWTDGPTTDSVQKFIDKYEYGSFDGMTDSYTADNVREDIPQVKFVFTQRTMSDATEQNIIEWIKANYAHMENFALNTYNEHWRAFGSQLVGRRFNENSFAA